jgi:hypothetical protein
VDDVNGVPSFDSGLMGWKSFATSSRTRTQPSRKCTRSQLATFSEILV